MADEGSIFAKAGFELPKASASDISPAVTSAPSASTSIFAKAGFQLPDGKPVAASEPSWKDHEALENLAAMGARTEPGPAKPGRGIARALWDYLPHVASGLRDTVAAPGNVLASNKPSTSESLIPAGLGLAGLVTGGEFPRAGGALVADKILPSSQSVNKLVEAIRPENVPEVIAGMRANPRMTAADLSDPVRIDTQGMMAKGTPDVQDFISRTTRERAASRPDAVNSAYTEAMGPAPDVLKMVEGLKDRARKAGSEAIQPALANAKPVDVSPVIAAIEEKLKPGVTALMGETKLPLSELEQELVRFKSRLTDGENQVFDSQKLHRIQSDIGDQAFQLSKSPNPKDRMLGKELRGFNEKLIDQIDASASGTYRPARAKFKDAKDIHEAFDSGFDTLKNRSGVTGALEDSPSALKDWMKAATPEEVVARRLGTRADIDQKINGVKNGALAGEGITKIPYNREKLTTLFGDKEAGRLIRTMEDSQREAATSAAILHGSKTAETTASGDRIKVRDVGGGNPLRYVAPVAAEMLGQGAGLPGVGFAASMAANVLHLGAQKVGQILDKKTNLEYARKALATGPAREKTINALLSHPNVIREFKKRANALSAQ